MSEVSPKAHKWVRGFVDYGALAIFMVAYFVTGRDMQQATWALVAGSAVALAVGFAVERRIAPLPLLAGGAALFFGGLALIFHDPRLLKIKPTVMNLAFAAALFIGLALKKNPLKALLGEAIQLPDAGWKRLTLSYAVFFLILAVINEVVWRTQPEEVWVLFRFPGIQILSVVFSLTQVPLMMKYAKTDEPPPPPVE